MYICHSPSSSAAPKPPKASQKWARISRLLCNTVDPPPIRRQFLERGLVDDFDPRPHALMADAAEFVARHIDLGRGAESRGGRRDVSRHQHRIDVAVFDQEAVDDIGTGGTE